MSTETGASGTWGWEDTRIEELLNALSIVADWLEGMNQGLAREVLPL